MGNIMGNIWNKYGKHAGKHNRSCGKPDSIKQISFMVFIDTEKKSDFCSKPKLR